MKYMIFGAENCPRCAMVKKRLESMGGDVIVHDSEYHSQPQEGWREKPIEYMEHLAQVSAQNQELPAVYCCEADNWVDVDELLEG